MKNQIKLILIVISMFSLLIPTFAYSADFTATAIGDYGNVTVMEVSGDYDAKNPDGTPNAVPRREIAKEFFSTHKDEYDFLAIFTNFDFEMPYEDAVAFYTGVRNDTQGLSLPIFDYSDLYGSDGRLQGTINMGNISNLEMFRNNPQYDNVLNTLSHEVLHRWAAYVSFIDSSGEINTSLLGKNESHWSFLLDADGSVLYGNDWQDNGDGTFTSIASNKYYSPLDLYLMGFYDKSEVPPMLLIDNPSVDPARNSEEGVTIDGTASYVTIDDIIAAEGERVPSASESQKEFKSAFILVTRPATFTGSEIYGIENIRNGWVTRFSVLTDGQGLMQIASTLKEDLPINPGVLPPDIDPRTLPPDVNDGVTWLMNNQMIDGSWMDMSHTTVRDTAETVITLEDFDVAAQNYSTGLQWLEAESLMNTDYLSRKIEAVSGSGNDVKGLIDELLSRQNSDGGWGSEKGYLSNPIDTSLVLKALASAGYSDQDVISGVIDYLKLKQTSDGGWGNYDDGSNIQATVNVLSAFNKIRDSYQLEDQINTATAWLLTKQNSDGGFGNSPSTVYDSAVAILALSELGLSTEITSNAVNYVLGLQAEDGSWYESPYQTALAVQAVWKATVDPDLSIQSEDISFIPEIVEILPTTAVINAEIWNQGQTDVPQATVVLYDGAISEQNKISEQTLAFPGQSSVTVTFSATITDGSGHTFYVVLDPDNLINESSEANNTAVKTLSPQTTYDFEALNISVSVNPVDVFQDITITSNITNHGTRDAVNVQLKYYVDEAEGPFDIATVTVDIPAGGTITNEYVWTTNKAGENLALTVHADPFDTFTELSETNNQAVTYLTVNDSTEPNLTVSYQDMVITPRPAQELGSANISALIKNQGFSVASNISVHFYKGVPDAGGVLLGTKTILSLNAGESSTVSFDWTNIMDSGERIIYVQVDPENLITEIIEDDNDAFTTLYILSLPDLIIAKYSIVFSPAAPKEGDVVSIDVTVQNAGEQEASDVTVTAYEGSTVIGSQIIPVISGNSQGVVSFTYDTADKKGVHEITIAVDPDNAIAEQKEDNNRASRTFGVQDADLWLTEPYISPNGDSIKDSTQFFFGLETPQTVKIIIVNEKGEIKRTYDGSEFIETTGGNIIWDGIGDDGVLVDDGQYQIQVVDVNNTVINSLLVVVDNNSSPLIDAMGTEYLLNNNLTCELPVDLYGSRSDENWEWFPDESGILFYIDEPNQNAPEYPTGLYTTAPDGKDILRIVPWEWTEGIDPANNYYYKGYELSPDGEKVAFILRKIGDSNLNQLWVVDSDGSSLTLLDSYDQSEGYIRDIRWSPDNSYIVYQVNNDELWIVKPDATGKTKIDSDVYVNFFYLDWSPDSKKIVYYYYFFDNDGNYFRGIRITDTSGNKEDILPGSSIYYIDWFDNQKIILAGSAGEGWEPGSLWLLDASGGGNHVKISSDLAHDWNDQAFYISPDRKKFAFIEAVDSEDRVSVKMTDTAGYTTVLYEAPWASIPIWGEAERINITDLSWSYDGKRLAFLDISNLETKLIIFDTLTDDIEVFNLYESGLELTQNDVEKWKMRILISWMPDNKHLLFHTLKGIFTVNSITGQRGEYLSIEGSSFSLSPFGRYITYKQYVDEFSVCQGKGTYDLWAISSLLNLTADLRATREKSAVVLKGIAADLNFEGYMLEYADTKNPDVWNLVKPPSGIPVVNDVFTTWVPPYEGTFYVRLSVWDKAGNVSLVRKRISWGLFSSITNLYKSLEIFSPNSDGVKDTVELFYRVLEPVHLDFNIYDEDNKLIKTIQKDYTSPVDDYITWDGRDSGGNVMPDGTYKIEVFTYDFFVKVDNTLPAVYIDSLLGQGSWPDYYTLWNLFGHAFDGNLKNWLVEYGKGENPQEWYWYGSGIDPLVKTDTDGNPVLDPIADTTISQYILDESKFQKKETLWNIFGGLEGRTFRLTAEDFAGNITTHSTNMIEERIIFYQWDWFYISLGGTGIPGIKPGLHTISVVETIRNEITGLIVQYNKGELDSEDNPIWYDDQTITDSLSKGGEFTWDSSNLDNNDIRGIRIKAVDIFGIEYYSNEAYVGNDLRIDEICGTYNVLVTNTLREALVLLKLQIRSDGDPRYHAWTDYQVYDSAKGSVIPTGTFDEGLDDRDVIVGIKYEVRMIGIGESGKIYQTGTLSVPSACECEITTSFKLNVDYVEAEACGFLSGKAELSVEFELSCPAILKSLTYYIQSSPDTWDVLKSFDLSKERIESITIDTNSLEQGKYPVKATLTYEQYSELKEMTTFNPSEPLINPLIVDRVLPDARITYPNQSLMLCPIKFDSPVEWFGVNVEGFATDNNDVQSYELYYGIGENPFVWMHAETRVPGKIDPEPISGEGSVQGQIGMMDITDLSGSVFSLKLKAVDITGNVSCYETGFNVDEQVDITALSRDKTLFSPNGDGILDDVNVRYEIDEYAVVDVKTFKLLETGNSYVLDSTPLRTLVSELQHPGGSGSTSWDGKDDSGVVVPDGLYAIEISVTDYCLNTRQQWGDVEVDNTPPITVITYPAASDPLGNIVEIKGTADDTHFLNYTLEYGEGEAPADWFSISSFTNPVEDNILGTWNTYGLEDGKWTLRLSATDTVANKSETRVTIDLGQRKDLIKDLDAVPKLFSPNNDSKLDTTNINYEITDTSDVKIEIFNSADALKKTYTTAASSAGTYTYTWDGKDDPGTLVPDGEYSAKLTAVLSSNPSVTQEEAITLIVDTTPPVVDIEQPEENSFIMTDVAVNGTISDKNLEEYSVAYTGNSGTELLDNAGQSREDYTFGIINEPPEGEYTLTVTAKDLGENTTDRNIIFTIDRTPPKVTLNTPKQGEYYGSDKDSVNIEGTIDEINLETYSLRYGAGDNPVEWTEILAGNVLPVEPQLFIWGVGKDDGIPDGLYTLSLYVKDRAGLEGEAKAGIVIDNTLPDALISGPQDGEYVKKTIDVKGTAFDENLDNYILEFSEGNCIGAFKWTAIKGADIPVQDGVLAVWQALPPDGDYCLRLTVADKVDNKAEAKTDVKVDTQPPAPPELSGEVENRTDARLDWTQNTEPDLAGYNLYRDNQQVNSDLITDITYLDQMLKQGIYTYVVKAVDFAGWESEPSNEVQLAIDTTGPDARISLPKDASSVSGLVDIKGTAYSSDDFKEYRVYTGQGSEPSFWNLIRTSPVPTTYGTLTQWDTIGLGEGEIYSVKLEAEDINGNINTSRVTVTIDNTPPAAPVLISVTDDVSDVTVEWQANTEPDLAGYLLYRNDQLANVAGIVVGDLKPYLINGISYLDEGLPDGKFRYYLFAMDKAGNISDQSNTIEVTLDTHPPQAVIVEPSDGSGFEYKIFVKAESPDLDVTSIQFEYKNTQSGIWLSLGDAVITEPYFTYLDPEDMGLTYGSYNLRAVATDGGGQTDVSPAYITVVYDNVTAPAVPELNALTDGQNVTLTWTANDEEDFAGYNIYRTDDSSRTKINTDLVIDAVYTDSGLSDGMYIYEVTAVDIYANESSYSNSVSAKIYAPLIAQPYTPTGQNVIQINGSNAEADSTVEIFVDAGSGPISQGSTASDVVGDFMFDAALLPGENRITAKVIDSIGNISRESDEVIVVYNEPPSAPTGLSADINGDDVNLTWNPNPEADLSGYNVYKNGEKLNAPSEVSGTALSSPHDPLSGPELAIDNDPSTYWQPYISYPVWWQIDLASPELISRIEIIWGNDFGGGEGEGEGEGEETIYEGKNYEIQFWSGYAWITHSKVTGDGESGYFFEFSPSYRTDKIRIFITDAVDPDNGVRISEIEIIKDNLKTGTSYDDMDLNDGTYNYTVTAVDYYGFESLPSDSIQPIVGDVTPPSAPENLTAAASGVDIILNWSANTEGDLAGYNIYRNTAQGWLGINASLVTETAYTDANLPNGSYTYRITAVDTAGNESLPSNEASASVYIEPPQPPINLTVSSPLEGAALNASWEYAGEPAAGYNLYRSTASGGPYTKVNSSLIIENTYLDTGLTNGTAYYYVVVAEDSSGNESVYSNEAMGIPSDTVAPEMPNIFFPTVTGVPIVLSQDATDIIGYAEPGANVEVFVNNISQGLTTARINDEFFNTTLQHNNYYGMALSSDNSNVVFSDSSRDIYIKDLNTETESGTGQQGYYPKWSPDGRQILYRAYPDNKLMIYDSETGDVTPVTEDSFNEYGGEWSPDGSRVAFHSNRTGNYEIWIKDLITGELNQTTFTGYAVYPKWSPDGQRIIYRDSSWNIYYIDLVTGETTEIDLGSFYYEWSPDGDKIVYTIGNSIRLMDVESQEKTNLTLQGSIEKKPVWSPDGRELIFIYWDNNIRKYLLTLMDINTNERFILVPEGTNSEPKYILWNKAGRVLYSESYAVNIIDPAGIFHLEDADLKEGRNVITAVAVDESDNQSLPSEEVVVNVDLSLLPDLETLENDIYIYPVYPLTGEQAVINVVVRNTGGSGAENVDVDIYIWDSAGMLELVKSETISYMAPDSVKIIEFTWDSTNQSGVNTVIAVLDPEDRIAEQSEANNYAARDFIVVEEEGLSMTTTLNSDVYGSNDDANINIEIINSGIERDVVLDVSIEDTNGYEVASFETISAYLAYGAKEYYSFVWNTGTTYAGTYQAHAILKNPPEIMAEDVIPFEILADVDIGLTAATDKARYDANEDVTVSFNVANNGINYIIPELTAAVSITDSDGIERFTDNKTLTNLLPGVTSALASVWNTGLDTPGDYTAVVDIFVDGQLVTSESSAFNINESIIITGSIKAVPAVVNLGNNVNVEYDIQNNGNSDASGLVLRVLVTDPATQAVMKTYEEIANLLIGGVQNRELIIPTEGYGQKTYSISLKYEYDGEIHNIAGTSFTVIDGTPPVISILSPEADSFHNSTVDITAIVSDNVSGIDNAEYQIDGGSWKLLPVSDPSKGRYSTTWSPLVSDEGTHTVFFRATDKAGNTSNPVSVVVTVDMTPPVIQISGVEDGQFYNTDVTPVVSITDANPDTEAITLNGGVFVSGTTVTSDGQYSLNVTAADKAGNTSTLTINFTMDKTPPEPPIIISPPDGSTVDTEAVDIVGQAEPGSTVEMGFINIFTTQADPVTGDFMFTGVVLIPGENIFIFTATDNVGNESGQNRYTLTLSVGELVLTKSVYTGTRTLIWIDDRTDCHDDDDGDNDDGDDDSCDHHESTVSGTREFIENALEEMGGMYEIVTDEDDFEFELRSGIYNTYIIADSHSAKRHCHHHGRHHRSIHPKLQKELREAVYRGEGLVFVKTSPSELSSLKEALGVKFKGVNRNNDTAIITLDTEITDSGLINFEGDSVKVETITASTIGYFEESSLPAITANDFGAGKTVLFVFNPVDITEDILMTEIFKNSLNYVLPEEYKQNPLNVLEVLIKVEAVHADFDIKIEEIVPPEVEILGISEGGILEGDTLTWQEYLETETSSTFSYLIRLPDIEGTYTLETILLNFVNDSYSVYDTEELTLYVERDSSNMAINIIDLLDDLNAHGHDRARINKAIKYIRKILQRNVRTSRDAERNIYDAINAAINLGRVETLDVSSIRIEVDELLKIWEVKWYQLII